MGQVDLAGWHDEQLWPQRSCSLVVKIIPVLNNEGTFQLVKSARLAIATSSILRKLILRIVSTKSSAISTMLRMFHAVADTCMPCKASVLVRL
jgi:hypothetical protein